MPRKTQQNQGILLYIGQKYHIFDKLTIFLYNINITDLSTMKINS